MAEIEDLGIRVVAISVDEPAASGDFCGKAGYTFLFDPKAGVIRR